MVCIDLKTSKIRGYRSRFTAQNRYLTKMVMDRCDLMRWHANYLLLISSLIGSPMHPLGIWICSNAESVGAISVMCTTAFVLP